MWVDLPILFYEKSLEEMERDESLGIDTEVRYNTVISGVNLNHIGIYNPFQLEATFDDEFSLKSLTSIHVDGNEFLLNLSKEEFESVLFGGVELHQKWVEFMTEVENEEAE